MKARREESGLRFLQAHEYRQLQRPGAVQDGVLNLPCGRCIGCRLERGQQWAMRIIHEASLQDDNAFLTLTYSDEFLPHGDLPTLHYPDVQRFLKRIRKAGIGLRYFCAGEYGGETSRPHYHLITFGWKPEFSSQATARTWYSDELEAFWSDPQTGRPLGSATVGEVTPASAAYVAQYALKKQYGRANRERGRKPEFCSMSQGIGKGWLDRWSMDLDRGYAYFNGRKVRIPRYYATKKGESDPEWLASYEASRERFLQERDPAEYLDDRMAAKETVVISRRAFFNSNNREPDEAVK